MLKPKVCVNSLALLYNTDKRTIQKDFELLKEYFEEQLSNKTDDCYFLLKQEYFYDLFKHNHKTSK